MAVSGAPLNRCRSPDEVVHSSKAESKRLAPHRTQSASAGRSQPATRDTDGSQAMPAAVLVLLIAGAAAILPISGRTPDEWLPVVAARSPRVCEASTGIGRGEQARASRALSTARPSSDRRRCRRCCAAAACSAPISPTAASWECSRTQSWARTRPSSSCTHAPSALLPPAEHERRLEQWGQVLAALARRGSAIRRLQIIEHTAPSDGHLRQPAAFR